MALYCFGDSYTEGYKNDMNFWPYDAYRKYLGVDKPEDMPPLWSEILGEKLGIDSFNYALGGSSNQEIFFNICEHSSKFKKDDIVIINWTYVQRILWDLNFFEDENTFFLSSVSPYQAEHYDTSGKFHNTWKDISENRSSFQWTWEVIRYEQIIDTLATHIGFKVYYWFTDDYLFQNFLKIKKTISEEKYIINDLISEYKVNEDAHVYASIPLDIIKLYGGLALEDETNGVSGDRSHLGGIGHKIQAELFYSYITKTPYPKKLEKYL